MLGEMGKVGAAIPPVTASDSCLDNKDNNFTLARLSAMFVYLTTNQLVQSALFAIGKRFIDSATKILSHRVY